VARQQRERQRDDEGSGSALTKAEPVARRGRQKRWRDDEGSGGATISNGAMMKVTAARRRRQNRRCNDEGSGGASMKLAAA
jgi:hypothetical protein